MHQVFCDQCNRIRLTADGKVRPCLFSDQEFDIRTALATGTDQEVRAVIAENAKVGCDAHVGVAGGDLCVLGAGCWIAPEASVGAGESVEPDATVE